MKTTPKSKKIKQKQNKSKARLKEIGGRDFKTINNDPFSYSDHPGIDVEIFPVDVGEAYAVQITVHADDHLSTPLRNFPSESEADHFARSYVEYVLRVLQYNT
jgi:hypothetical protein